MVNLHISLTPFKNESRVLKQTKSLIKNDLFDKVVIIALHEKGLEAKEVLSSQIEVIRIILKSRGLSKGIFSQIIKYLELSLRILTFAIQNRPKVVNIHGLTLLPLGSLIKLFTSAKLVYDTHELETETDGLTGIRQLLARWVERIFIRYVDATIVVGDQIQNWYISKYKCKNIETVLNCPYFVNYEKSDIIRDELKIEKSRKIILYLGGISEGRGIRFLLDAFNSLEDNNYALVFIGYGELEELVLSYSRPEEVILYAGSADIGISIIADNCLSYTYCLPNKLFEYIMAGIPSIISDLPEMRQIVDFYKIGVVISGKEQSELKVALEKLEQISIEHMKNNLNNASKIFNWENQEGYYINAMNLVIDKLK
jgi:glycosyltransferase involved in cell wall biosynthesis